MPNRPAPGVPRESADCLRATDAAHGRTSNEYKARDAAWSPVTMSGRTEPNGAEALRKQVDGPALDDDARRLLARSLLGQARRVKVSDPATIQRLATIVRAARGGRAAS